MMLIFARRFAASTSIVNLYNLPLLSKYCSSSKPYINKSEPKSYSLTSADSGDGSGNHLGGIYSLPLLSRDTPLLDSHEIKVVDLDAWSVSSSLACASKSKPKESQLSMFGVEEVGDELFNDHIKAESDPDLDEIEDMRIRGNLFYKIEKSSIEFQEYNFDFHGRKIKSNTNDERESKKKRGLSCGLAQNKEKPLKGKASQVVVSKNSEMKDDLLVNKERLARSIKENYVVSTPQDLHGFAGKKLRSPTFNQITGPYHEPFCLDIHVSKGSVRACVVHRVTSKVIVVAHSISKDMKFDLGSPKSRVAAASVGKFLAQRALGDDIHDVIYTPRKGDKLEGKLQIVLQSIIDNGVNVKVRLKQRNPSKPVRRSLANEVVGE